jgi:NTE family protein
MAPISAVKADVTIAVSLSGPAPDDDVDPPADPETRASTEWLGRLLRSTSGLLDSNTARSILDTPAARSMLSRFGTGSDSDSDDGAEDLEAPIPRLGSFAVMNRTIEIAQAALARHQMAAYPPDLLIEVPRTACRSLEFHRAAEVIDLGRELAAKALDGYRRTLTSETP